MIKALIALALSGVTAAAPHPGGDPDHQAAASAMFPLEGGVMIATASLGGHRQLQETEQDCTDICREIQAYKSCLKTQCDAGIESADGGWENVCINNMQSLAVEFWQTARLCGSGASNLPYGVPSRGPATCEVNCGDIKDCKAKQGLRTVIFWVIAFIVAVVIGVFRRKIMAQVCSKKQAGMQTSLQSGAQQTTGYAQAPGTM